MRRFSVAPAVAALVAGGLGSAASAAPVSVTVAVLDRAVAPAVVQVAPGGSVRWTNGGRARHAIAGPAPAIGRFVLAPRGSHAVRFPRPGVFEYTVDGSLRGVVVVALTAAGQKSHESWKGSIVSATKLVHDTHISSTCTGTWRGTFSFGLADDGSVSGGGNAHQVGRAACPFRELPDPAPAYGFVVVGTAEKTSLKLTFVLTGYGATRHDYAGFSPSFFAGGLVSTYVLRRRPGDHAGKHFTVSYSVAGGIAHASAGITLAAERSG